MAILTLRNVSKFFGDADNGSEQVVAINDVSFDVSAENCFFDYRTVGLRQIEASTNHP